MRTRLFSELKADAYKLADLEDFTDRYPSTEVGRYINQGISELWDLLVSANGYAYYGKPLYGTPTLTGSGAASPPVITVTGVPRIGTSTTFTLYVDIGTGGALGTATFRYSRDAGVTYSSVITTAVAGVHFLSDIGLTLTFAAGTYDAAHIYTSSAVTKPSSVVGQLAYALPTDFYKLHRIYTSDSASSILELELLQSEDEPLLLTTSNSSRSRYYQIRDGYIDLLPSPSAAETLNITYVPTAPQLAADTDIFDGHNGFEEYPVAYAAHQMLLKEGDIELANMAMQKLNKLRERLVRAAADRDSGTPQRVQDVRGALAWRNRARSWTRW